MKSNKCKRKNCTYAWKEEDPKGKQRWVCHVYGGCILIKLLKQCPMTMKQ